MYICVIKTSEGDILNERELEAPRLLTFYELADYAFANGSGELAHPRPLPIEVRQQFHYALEQQHFHSVQVHRRSRKAPVIWRLTQKELRKAFLEYQQIREVLTGPELSIEIFPHGFTETNLWSDLTLLFHPHDTKCVITYFARDVFRTSRYAKLVTEADLFYDPEIHWNVQLIPGPIRKSHEYIDIVRQWINGIAPSHANKHDIFLHFHYQTQ